MEHSAASVPRVSFLMATNRADEPCRQAIASCLAQTFSNFEIVIVANGLADEDYRTLQDFCDPHSVIRLFRTEIRRLTYSLNLGLHHARGEYIARMDADDLAYPNRIAEQVSYMDGNLETTVCGSWCDLIDTAGAIVGEWKYPKDNASIKRALRHSNPLCHPTVMYRKQALLQRGGYCGFFAEDYVTWALMSVDEEVQFANIPQKLLAYRANHAGHQRNLTWLNAKSALAGVQVQLFGMTHNPLWLLGAFFNLMKTYLRRH